MAVGKYVIKPDDDVYPELVRGLEDPPALYVLGDPEILRTEMLSIVGARRATPYGLAVAEMAARIGAECSLTVVSGGARGCDHAAGRAALDAGGNIIVVAGTGADKIYPASSTDIFLEAAEGKGAVVSLLPWGTGIQKFQFPQRNRIIAALSRATFVAEAGLSSGTMSTAETVQNLGRGLFSVPGSIFSPTSSGTNKLIADGADIICDEQDLEQAIASQYNLIRGIARQGSAPQGEVLSALFASPSRPRELAERLNKDVITVIHTLSEYEVMGLVSKLPDGRYTPSRDAFLSHNRRQ